MSHQPKKKKNINSASKIWLAQIPGGNVKGDSYITKYGVDNGIIEKIKGVLCIQWQDESLWNGVCVWGTMLMCWLECNRIITHGLTLSGCLAWRYKRRHLLRQVLPCTLWLKCFQWILTTTPWRNYQHPCSYEWGTRFTVVNTLSNAITDWAWTAQVSLHPEPILLPLLPIAKEQ